MEPDKNTEPATASAVDAVVSGMDFDDLECPRCGKECKPVNELRDGSVRYETHLCNNGYEIHPTKKSFKIHRNGHLIE